MLRVLTMLSLLFVAAGALSTMHPTDGHVIHETAPHAHLHAIGQPHTHADGNERGITLSYSDEAQDHVQSTVEAASHALLPISIDTPSRIAPDLFITSDVAAWEDPPLQHRSPPPKP